MNLFLGTVSLGLTVLFLLDEAGGRISFFLVASLDLFLPFECQSICLFQ